MYIVDAIKICLYFLVCRLNNFNAQNSHDENQLKMRVQPSKFSGPEHLRRLVDKCFSKKIDSYVGICFYFEIIL